MNDEGDVAHGESIVEPIGQPGVSTGWVLRVDEVTGGSRPDEAATVRSYARNLQEIERFIAARLEEYGNSVDRVEHLFHARVFQLRTGSRVEFRWQLMVSDWRCRDCGVDTDAIAEYYMVHQAIWDEATDSDGPDGHLCIECLEDRLGRTLASFDFTGAKINTDDDPRSPRLAARLVAESSEPMTPRHVKPLPHSHSHRMRSGGGSPTA